MKKTLRNLVIVLLVSMMFGTTCFAGEVKQIYIDGDTIADTASTFATAYEEKKASKPAGSYTYSVFNTSNTIIVVTLETDGFIKTTTTSIVFDPINKVAVSTITSVVDDVAYTDTETYPMNIELK